VDVTDVRSFRGSGSDGGDHASYNQLSLSKASLEGAGTDDGHFLPVVYGGLEISLSVESRKFRRLLSAVVASVIVWVEGPMHLGGEEAGQ